MTEGIMGIAIGVGLMAMAFRAIGFSDKAMPPVWRVLPMARRHRIMPFAFRDSLRDLRPHAIVVTAA